MGFSNGNLLPLPDHKWMPRSRGAFFKWLKRASNGSNV